MKRSLRWWLLGFCGLGLLGQEPSSVARESTVLLVIGASGTEEYAAAFGEWAESWRQAAELGGAELVAIGTASDPEPSPRVEGVESDRGAVTGEATGELAARYGIAPTTRRPAGGESESTDLARLAERLALESTETSRPLWLVLIGHGTFDGKHARFNLRGPDLTAERLAELLEPVRRPVAVLHCAAASAPFISKLSGPGRVVVTATRSGYELNYARFGRFMAAAIASPDADLDGDGQTSLLEAFLMTSRRVSEFYETDGRIVTEHALIDDNGDQRGTPADWFRGIRVVKEAADGALPDGNRAHQWHLVSSPRERAMPAELRARRDALELSIARLRTTKATLDETVYYERLEIILLELARIYDAAEIGEP